MPLPSILPADVLELDGQSIPYHSLTRTQVGELNALPNEDAKEVFVLARGCGVTDDEAIAFRDTSSSIACLRVMGAVLIISGLATEASWAARMAAIPGLAPAPVEEAPDAPNPQ